MNNGEASDPLIVIRIVGKQKQEEQWQYGKKGMLTLAVYAFIPE